MKNQIDPERALTQAFLSAEAENWTQCRSALEDFFMTVPVENVRHFTPSCLHEAMLWTKMLVKSGLDRESEGTPARAWFLRVTAYTLNHAPSEMRAMLDAEFRKIFPQVNQLEPAGYDEAGVGCYRLGDLCRVLGIDPEEVMETLLGVEGAGSLVKTVN